MQNHSGILNSDFALKSGLITILYTGMILLSNLQRTANNWQQGCALSQWALDTNTPNNPRIADATTTLMDTNQVSRQTFSYDCYNNKTDGYEYDYGTGAPGT